MSKVPILGIAPLARHEMDEPPFSVMLEDPGFGQSMSSSWQEDHHSLAINQIKVGCGW